MVSDNYFNKKKKKKIILAVVLLITSIILVSVGLLFVFKDNNPKKIDTSSLSLDYQYLATTDKGEYIISDASTNISFEITEGTKFKILDENNKAIEAKVIDNKIVNPEGYKKGKKYVLTIEDGDFVSEQLKETDTVTFKIARDEVKKYKLKDDVIKVQKNNIEIINEKLVVSNSNYMINDVIVVYDNEKIVDAYVITSIDGQGNYSINDATLEQIYSELDFYYEEYADLSNYQASEELKKYVIESTKKSDWYNAIIETVNAIPKISVEFELVENGIKAKVTVALEAGDVSSFLDSKYHNFEVSCTYTFQAITLFDITLTDWNMSVQFVNQKDFEFKINNKFIDYDGDKTNKELYKKIQDALDKKRNVDSNNKEYDMVIIPIPTPVPGLTFQFEISLVTDVSMSVDFSTKLSFKTVTTSGFDYGKGEDFKPLSSFDFEILETSLSASGNIELKGGIKVAAQIDFVGLLEGGISASAGLYGKANALASVDFINDILTLKFGAEAGIFVDIGLELDVCGVEFKYSLLAKEFPIPNLKYEKIFNSKNIITFDTDGGSEVEKQIIDYGKKLEKPEDPVKEGYEFKYWSLGDKKYNFDEKVTSQFELKAVWSDGSEEVSGSESDSGLSNIKNQMTNGLGNYSYDVEITANTGVINIAIEMSCKEDRKNQVGYCYSSMFGVKTEQYIDYANQVAYNRVTMPYGIDPNSGKWTSSKYAAGAPTNSWVGLSDYISNIKSVSKDGGTYYTGTINSRKLAEAMSEVDTDMNASSIISNDINISVFVNSSNYIEKMSFNIEIEGVEETVVVTYKDFNNSGSVTLPSELQNN